MAVAAVAQRDGAWAVTAVGGLALMAALGFGRFSYTLLLPSTRDGLVLSYTGAGTLATVNLAGYLIGSLFSRPIGRLAGPRATAASAVAVLALGLGWMSVVGGMTDAIAARALAGVAGGVLYVQALALVSVWFPGPARGLASGLMHMGNGAGLVLAGLGLPLLLEAAGASGWRWGWFALAIATLPVLPCAWCYLRSPDATDAIEESTGPMPERGAFPVEARQSRLLTYGALYGLFGLAYIIYVTFFAEALRVRGLALVQTGIAWAVIGALSLVSGPLWGMLSDRLGRMEGIAAVFALQSAAYFAFLAPGAWALAASAAVFGVTAWGIPAIMAAAMSDSGRVDTTMTAFGRITTVMGIGQAVGPLLAGASADATGIVTSGLWISIGASIVGAVWSVGTATLTPAAVHAGSRRFKA